jgi:hypothetical protein
MIRNGRLNEARRRWIFRTILYMVSGMPSTAPQN